VTKNFDGDIVTWRLLRRLPNLKEFQFFLYSVRLFFLLCVVVLFSSLIYFSLCVLCLFGVDESGPSDLRIMHTLLCPFVIFILLFFLFFVTFVCFFFFLFLFLCRYSQLSASSYGRMPKGQAVDEISLAVHCLSANGLQGPGQLLPVLTRFVPSTASQFSGRSSWRKKKSTPGQRTFESLRSGARDFRGMLLGRQAKPLSPRFVQANATPIRPGG